ncbi:MAG TPA: hypothetical protein VFJ63_00955 [Candidatus Bathyarchaeia archaeon]|nr:hypothetical protein [Candidatus Bathyarchaeia archaeon]
MPRQLLVYMSHEDEAAFLDYLKSRSDTIVLPSRSQTNLFQPVDSLPDSAQEPATRRFWLQSVTTRLPLVTEEEGGFFAINGFQSPVAEFLRSIMVSQMLLPGRIQADMAYFDDQKQDLVSKPVEFKKWYDDIEHWIRTNYKHLTLLTFAGPGAEKFKNEGGLLH